MSYLLWLLGGRCHLCRDEGLDDIVSGWQQLAVAVGRVGALVQHQAAGGHCQRYRQKSIANSHQSPYCACTTPHFQHGCTLLA